MSDQREDLSPGSSAMTRLDERMRSVLGKLEMVSAGTTYSYEPVATKSGFASSLPASGDAHPPHVHFRWAYEQQTDDWGREQVIDQAERALDALTKRTVPEGFVERPETHEERRARLLEDGAGLPLSEAAFRMNCSERELLRVRRDEGRNPYDGTQLVDRPTRRARREDRAERARDLKRRNPGMSNRQIAMMIGVSHVSVASYLR